MTITRIAGTVVREGTTLALTAARHPIATTAGAIGLARGAVRGVIGVGEELLHGARTAPASHAPAPATTSRSAPEPAPAPQPERTSPEVLADEPALPGPDLFEPPMTDPADLPEPIVITADDDLGEAFQTEPKA